MWYLRGMASVTAGPHTQPCFWGYRGSSDRLHGRCLYRNYLLDTCSGGNRKGSHLFTPSCIEGPSATAVGSDKYLQRSASGYSFRRKTLLTNKSDSQSSRSKEQPSLGVGSKHTKEATKHIPVVGATRIAPTSSTTTNIIGARSSSARGLPYTPALGRVHYLPLQRRHIASPAVETKPHPNPVRKYV